VETAKIRLYKSRLMTIRRRPSRPTLRPAVSIPTEGSGRAEGRTGPKNPIY